MNFIDDSEKGRRIQNIKKEGHEVIVTILSDKLSDIQAIKLEAELISAFGTTSTGGILTNSVVPTGKSLKIRKNLIVPSGSKERAKMGLDLLKDAVLELARANKDGITNADAAKSLGLQSDYQGGSKDYLSWSIIGMLMREGKLKRVNRNNKGFHVAQVK
jgi:hypothetical protein